MGGERGVVGRESSSGSGSGSAGRRSRGRSFWCKEPRPGCGMVFILMFHGLITAGLTAGSLAAYQKTRATMWMAMSVTLILLMVPIICAASSLCLRRAWLVAFYAATTLIRAAAELGLTGVVFGWLGYKDCRKKDTCDLTGYPATWNVVIGGSFLAMSFLSVFWFFVALDFFRLLRSESAAAARDQLDDLHPYTPDMTTQESESTPPFPPSPPSALIQDKAHWSRESGMGAGGRGSSRPFHPKTPQSAPEWNADYFDDEVKAKSLVSRSSSVPHSLSLKSHLSNSLEPAVPPSLPPPLPPNSTLKPPTRPTTISSTQ